MEAKEIIEKMTKGLVIVPDKLSNVRVSSLKVSVSYGAGIGQSMDAMDRAIEQKKADISLIAEAFNVANQTGMTPTTLQAELEKAKELLRECQERLETILVIGVERDEVNILIRKLNTENV